LSYHRFYFAAAAAALALLQPAPSGAHAILEASQPSANGTVAAGTVRFRLRYNSRIDHARSRLTLIRPDQTRTVVTIVTGDDPGTASAAAVLTPGAYVLRWQVLAIDGHITRGDLPFTVTGP
jgi:methionine-rich copper-binding protein CopC